MTRVNRTEEALRQGLEVTAIVRDKNKITGKRVAILERDLFALTTEDVAGFDTVIDVFRAPQGKEQRHRTSMEHLNRRPDRLLRPRG